MPAVQLVEAYDQQTPRMTGTGPAAFSSTVTTSTATAEPQRYYIDTDHLGTPQELTDSEGRLQWAGHYRAWGELAKATDHSGQTARVEMPLRFQGQYCDAETGLHYNRHRYYDPRLGRFTTQDPISLAGGINLYQYAPNPVDWIDPFGLTAATAPGYYVYGLYDEGASKPYYVGITNDTTRRAQEHFSTGRLSQDADMRFLERNVTYGEARGYEQYYIEEHGTLTGKRGEPISSTNRGNKINSYDHNSKTRDPRRQEYFEKFYKSKKDCS